MPTMTLTVTEKWGTWTDRDNVARRWVEWTAREGRRIVMRAQSQEGRPHTYNNGRIDEDALKYLLVDAFGPDTSVEYVRKASDQGRAVPRIIRVTY